MVRLTAFHSATAGLVLTAALLTGATVAHAEPSVSGTTRTSVVDQALKSTSKPVIKGKHKVGVRLKASFRAWEPAPISMLYVWKRSGATISGADHRTYTVRKADRGHRLTVTVIGTKDSHQKQKRTSRSISIPRANHSKSCDSNYSPCVPIAYDVDCAGGSGNGPAYVQGPVRVIGRDVYGLDYDHDGWGCE